jgi:hypothetical protein
MVHRSDRLTGFGALPAFTNLRQLSWLMGTKRLRGPSGICPSCQSRGLRFFGRAFCRRRHFTALTRVLTSVHILTGRTAVTLASATPRPLHMLAWPKVDFVVSLRSPRAAEMAPLSS